MLEIVWLVSTPVRTEQGNLNGQVNLVSFRYRPFGLGTAKFFNVSPLGGKLIL